MANVSREDERAVRDAMKEIMYDANRANQVKDVLGRSIGANIQSQVGFIRSILRKNGWEV